MPLMLQGRVGAHELGLVENTILRYVAYFLRHVTAKKNFKIGSATAIAVESYFLTLAYSYSPRVMVRVSFR